MTSTNHWATRSIGNQLLDPSGLGRWSGLSYLGKKGKRLAILTAYRSPRQQPNGSFGFFDQQNSLLLSQGFKVIATSGRTVYCLVFCTPITVKMLVHYPAVQYCLVWTICTQSNN
jgi:hypothetical protein